MASCVAYCDLFPAHRGRMADARGPNLAARAHQWVQGPGQRESHGTLPARLSQTPFSLPWYKEGKGLLHDSLP